jgi:hypothetical protein
VTVLRIQYVYPGSECFPSRADPIFFHPGSASNNLSQRATLILTSFFPPFDCIKETVVVVVASKWLTLAIFTASGGVGSSNSDRRQ